MTTRTIASRVTVRRRYVRSVELVRDIDDPDALEGYVVTPSVQESATRILTGLAPTSTQRAFRVVGPYGSGKSAFGLFLARLFWERGQGPATTLLTRSNGRVPDIAPWRPTIVSGRRVSFAHELLRAVAGDADGTTTGFGSAKADAAALLARTGPLDAREVVSVIGTAASTLRQTTGEGLLLLVDEMGRFLEHAALGMEDPSIFQAVAERAGGGTGADLAIVGFLHHRFADYVAGLGRWMEAEWTRSSERYEELRFGSSAEQSLFMVARALTPVGRHSPAVRKRAAELYGEAVDRGVFTAARSDAIKAAPNLYPLHPGAIAALAWAMQRFGQNERSLFSFLGSLEPAGFQRFAHVNPYGREHWYRAPQAFDHLAATISDAPSSDRARRWSLAFDALARVDSLSPLHQDVLKTVALLSILEPVPGLVASGDTVAWSLGTGETETVRTLDDLAKRKLIYRRPHRGDYGLWSSSSVDLSRWLDEARLNIRAPDRFDADHAALAWARPGVAHRHYHATGTLRTFEVRLWTGAPPAARQADGLILIAPTYPGENMQDVLRDAAAAVSDDPMALVCARAVLPGDLKWAHELALWRWIRSNCDELRVDELARTEVDERIASAEQGLANVAALVLSAGGERPEAWWYADGPVTVSRGPSALLSDICDQVYDQAPILKNELVNRARLSAAGASARMRLLDRMLSHADRDELGMEGAPPERTIYRSLFQASGMHARGPDGTFGFKAPSAADPCRWRPVWKRIEERIDRDEPVGFDALMDELGQPPHGLRAGPALLVIAGFIVASKDRVAVMERNSFVPDLTTAHFMRLAKSPANFAVKSLREGPAREGVVRALAARLQTTPAQAATLHELSESLFGWYNALPAYTLQTRTLSPVAAAVRTALRKATEPGKLFFHDLPLACDAKGDNGTIDVDAYLESLDAALREIGAAAPKLRTQAAATAGDAFGAGDLATLRSQLRDDYGARPLDLVDGRLQTFVERAIDADASDEQWLDRITGIIVGRRLDRWDDHTLNRFQMEIRALAGNLARWRALTEGQPARTQDLRSVHVVGLDGRERVVVVHRDRPNPRLQVRLDAVREALGNEPQAVEVLGQLLAEYAERHAGWHEVEGTNTP